MIRNPVIELIRLLSVIIVILFHMDPDTFSFGYLGVDFFFILSGYFAANHLLNKQTDLNLSDYVFRRFLRIMPAIFGCIMALLIFQSLYGLPYETETFIFSLAPVIISVSNFYFWRQNDYFAFAENFEPLLHTWSTSVELQFFLGFALCVFLLNKYKNYIPFLAIIFSLCLLSFTLLNDLHSRPGVYFLLPFRLWEFAIGMVIFTAKIKFDKKTDLHLPSNFGAVCIFLLILFIYYLEIELIYLGKIYFFAIGIFSICFFIVVSGYEENKSSYEKVINFFSKFTFVIFVVHYPVISIFKEFFIINELIDYAYMLLIIAICTLILYRFTDFYYFRNQTKLLVSLTGGYLFLTFVFTVFLVRSDYTFNNDFKQDMRSSSLISELLQYDVDNFKAYVVGSFDRDIDVLETNKPILIIGDSFAKDFYNVLLKTNLYDRKSINLHYVPAECGFFKALTINLDTGCTIYSEGLNLKVEKADMVILANFWNVDNLAVEILRDFNFNKLKGKDILLVNEKNSNFPKLRKILEQDLSDGLFVQSIKNEKLKQQKKYLLDKLSKVASSLVTFSYYENVGNCQNCFRLANQNRLLSLDGQHLSESGAEYHAIRLIKLKNDRYDKNFLFEN